MRRWVVVVNDKPRTVPLPQFQARVLARRLSDMNPHLNVGVRPVGDAT